MQVTKRNLNSKTDKKINLIYGLNGTGKTVLSNYLYESSRDDKSENWPDFQDCRNSFHKSSNLLVYNEKFIEDIFYEEIPGIFTLSSENREAKENINNAENILNKEKNEKDGLTSKVIMLEKSLKRTRDNAEKVAWKIKTNYTGGDRLLDYCLYSLKSNKKILFDYLCKTTKPDKKPDKKVDDLKNIIKSIKEGRVIPKIPEIDITPNEIEGDPIFKEIIIGSQNSSVARLIEKLKNSDWVNKGLQYLPESIKEPIRCPFCQEKTITEGIAGEIRKYFDISYQETLDNTSQKQKIYNNFIDKVDNFKSEYQEHTFIKEKKDKFSDLVSRLKIILNDNLSSIQSKIQAPSKEVSLKSSEGQLSALDQFIQNINQKVQSHNTQASDSEDQKKKIKDTFWEIMRFDYDQTIQSYKSENKKIKSEVKLLEDKIREKQKSISEQKDIIKKNQRQTVNLETAILNINQNLRDIGITDFKIKKHSDNKSYFLTRGSSNGANFKSLSEGEKTVISFLYFLELCQGKASSEEVLGKKIIVIDDPVSSLSHIYIFNIAQFIKNKFFSEQENNYEQVFILTHSLYFFHELAGYSKRKKSREKQINLFRITKNPSSQIVEMSENEVKNDYEAYWELLKDYKHTNCSHPILPNIMRNILDHFFGFIDKAEFADALSLIDEGRYSAFIRYMNRESHSVRENINDTKELDHSLFFDAFKEVFKKTGYKKHYDKMMRSV